MVTSNGYRNPRIRKQISVYFPADEWRLLRDEAVRQRLPIAELCRRWIRPELGRTQDGDRNTET